jgi:hypothetical protein
VTTDVALRTRTWSTDLGDVASEHLTGLGLARLDPEGLHGWREWQRAGADGVQHGQTVLISIAD